MSQPVITMDYKDVQDILKRLKALDIGVQRTVARKAVKAMSKYIDTTAAPVAPVKTGNLRLSLMVQKVRTRGPIVHGRTAFSRGGVEGKGLKAVKKASAPYAMFLEFGSRSYRKKVHNRRKGKHKDHWKRWWKANLRKNEQEFIHEIDLSMDKEIRRLCKRSYSFRVEYGHLRR